MKQQAGMRGVGMGQHLIIEGTPHGKGRPRFTRTGHTYTDKKTADYEQQVREAYVTQVKASERETISENPVHMFITAVFSIPRSDSKAVKDAKLAGIILPTIKPDCDNIAKIVCDALNGLAYADDKQIEECKVEKKYGDLPRVEVTIDS